MDALVKITGIEEVQKMLAEAPKNVVQLGYGRALTAGINVFAGALASRTPVRSGKLAASLVIAVEVDSDARGGAAAVGFGKQGHVANWVEYGHRMVGHAPNKKETGAVLPHPFMRPAFDASADEALQAFQDSLVTTLNSEY